MTRGSILALGLWILALSPIRAGETSTTPNVVFELSADVVNALVRSTVDRTEPVEEEIQGSLAVGTGRTVGTVHAEFVPDKQKGILEIVFRGQVDAETVSARAMVSAYTSSTTRLEVRRRVVIDGKGISHLGGANFGRTAIYLREIKGRFAEPIVVPIAQEGFKRSKGAAEFETATKSAWNLSHGMAKELTPQLDGLRKAIASGFAFAQRGGMPVEAFQLETTKNLLHARLRFHTGQREIKPSPAPTAGADLNARFHHSIINEAAERAFGGRGVLLTELDKFYNEVTMGLLGDARKNVDEKGLERMQKLLGSLGSPITIDLAKKDPLQFLFTEQGFSFELSIASLQQDKKVYEGMRVRADYKFENVKEGIYLTRKGGVKFLPPASKEKKLEAQPFSFTVSRDLLFSEVLKDRFLLTSIALPDALSKVRFQPPRAGARDGWFALAWVLAE